MSARCQAGRRAPARWLSGTRRSRSLTFACCRCVLSPTVFHHQKTVDALKVSLRSPSPVPIHTKHTSTPSHHQHAANAARFSRVSGLVVDCCRPSHSTAPQSNRPRLLLSSSIDSSAIHRLTTSRIVTHPRLSHSAHSTSPLNSKSAHSPSLVLWRVTRNLRVAAARATRKQLAHATASCSTLIDRNTATTPIRSK